jgi:hypothetical protein
MTVHTNELILIIIYYYITIIDYVSVGPNQTMKIDIAIRNS